MFWLPILISFLSLILLANIKTAIAASPTFGPNILVSDAVPPSTGSSDGPPILDVDIAGGVYVAWIDHRNFQTEIFFSKLTGDGNTFSANRPLTGINDQKSFPQIEEDAGNIYIAWNERRVVNNQVQQGVFFTKSIDGGQTFTEEIFVDTSDELPINMIAHDNKLFIAYSQASKEIWLASSTDSGANFTKNRVSNFDNITRQRPTLDFIGNNVYAFWLEGNQVFFAKSPDSGANFDTAKSVFSHPDGAIHLLGNSFGRLSTKVKNQDIFLAFDFYLQTSNPFTTDSEVYFIKSQDGGATFSGAQRLPDDPPSGLINKPLQKNPSLTLLPDGSPVVAWYDERDGADFRKTILVYSQDQGENFSPNIRIDNTSGFGVFSAPTIVADQEGKIHFVRWDAALDPAGVYYTKIDLGLAFEPPPPTPFLDLPWDYQSKGLSFSEAALAINSYFDHEYPLLSSGLNEPTGTTNSIVIYKGLPRITEDYSSHDGYDYGNPAQVNIGDSVLAAEDGCASYRKTSAGGNIILIDHGNSYQTRYLHLQGDGLITKSSSCVNVIKGQSIGKVGATGNVIPPGEQGAHIHFMVVQDKNNDGNFDDNIPDGVTDPFGWQSTDPDPWPNFNFSFDGQDRMGNSSYYLWTESIANLSEQLTSNGGFFELEKYKMEFPEDATDQDLTIDMQMTPVSKPSTSLESIGSTITVTAKNFLGEFVEEFTKPYTIRIDFGVFDLSTFDLATISIHSSDDGINWQPEDTTVDLENKEATAQLNHLSHFALIAERLDTIAPTTTAILDGTQGQSGWFRSDVQVILDAQDNESGLGVDYTFYKIGEGDWQQYFEPLIFTQEGDSNLEFYSVDQDENIENIKKITFTIDKQTPEAKIYIDQTKKDLVVEGIDENETNTSQTTARSYKSVYTISDQAGNTLTMDVRDLDRKRLDKFKIYSLTYNQNPPQIQSKNLYRVIYQGRGLQLSVKEEYFKLAGVIKIKIKYDKKKNKSSIYTLQNGKLKLAEVRDGLVLLQLTTNQGNLEYSY